MDETIIITNQESLKEYPCKKCKEVFPFLAFLWDHQNQVHNDIDMACLHGDGRKA